MTALLILFIIIGVLAGLFVSMMCMILCGQEYVIEKSEKNKKGKKRKKNKKTKGIK